MKARQYRKWKSDMEERKNGMVKDQHVVYKTNRKVCASEIQFDVVNGICHNCKFDGGCRGNTQGVAALAEGLRLEDIAQRLSGIDCHGGDSCPNEFAKAAKELLEKAR